MAAHFQYIAVLSLRRHRRLPCLTEHPFLVSDVKQLDVEKEVVACHMFERIS